MGRPAPRIAGRGKTTQKSTRELSATNKREILRKNGGNRRTILRVGECQREKKGTKNTSKKRNGRGGCKKGHFSERVADEFKKIIFGLREKRVGGRTEAGMVSGG